MKAKTFHIEEKDLKRLKDLSKKTHLSEAELIRIALKKFLENEEKTGDLLIKTAIDRLI